MRLVIDSLIALMVLGVLGGVLYLHQEKEQDERQVEAVIDALDRLHAQTQHHAALETAIAGRTTVVANVMPAWFGDAIPVNILVGPDQPWIDLAPPGDDSDHPPDPIVTRPDQAGFWYNPANGVFRARVAPQLGEAKTLDLYNRINGSSLDAFEPTPDPDRRPLCYTPGVTAAISYASPAAEWIENSDTAELQRPIAIVTPHVGQPEPGPDPSFSDEPAIIHDIDEILAPAPDADAEPATEETAPGPAPGPAPEPAPRPTLPKRDPPGSG